MVVLYSGFFLLNVFFFFFFNATAFGKREPSHHRLPGPHPQVVHPAILRHKHHGPDEGLGVSQAALRHAEPRELPPDRVRSQLLRALPHSEGELAAHSLIAKEVPFKSSAFNVRSSSFRSESQKTWCEKMFGPSWQCCARFTRRPRSFLCSWMEQSPKTPNKELVRLKCKWIAASLDTAATRPLNGELKLNVCVPPPHPLSRHCPQNAWKSWVAWLKATGWMCANRRRPSLSRISQFTSATETRPSGTRPSTPWWPFTTCAASRSTSSSET